MKSKYIVHFALTILFASLSAKAATGLEGDYKFNGYECRSGALAKSPLAMDGWEGSFDMSANFTESQLTSNMNLTTKISTEKGQEYLNQFSVAIAQVNQLPDGPEKQKSLDEMNKSIEALKKLIEGTTCSSTFVMKYKISGNKIQTVPVSSSGTCNTSGSEESDLEFTLVGNVLKVANPSNKDICPNGDLAINVFERVK